jgi:TRAP-type mannitol/chloroaromatic compound transport system permease small subunit
MAFWQRLARGIDRLNGIIGHAVAWLTLAMVLVGAFNAVARYSGRTLGVSLASNAWIELQWYLFSLVFLLGAAWVLRDDGHVRVDVIFSRLSERAQARINIIGLALLAAPFCVVSLWAAWPTVRNSWLVREGSPDPGGLPRWPLKPLLLVCFALLLLQIVAELVHQVERLRRPAGEAVGAAGDAHHEPPLEGV